MTRFAVRMAGRLAVLLAGPAKTDTGPPAEETPEWTLQAEAAVREARDWFRENGAAPDEEYLAWTRIHVAAVLRGYGWCEARLLRPPQERAGPGVRVIPPRLDVLLEDTYQGLVKAHESHRRARARQAGA